MSAADSGPVRAAMSEEAYAQLRERLVLAAEYGYLLQPHDAQAVIAELDGMRRAERYHVAMIRRLSDRLAEARDSLAAVAAERAGAQAQDAAGEEPQ